MVWRKLVAGAVPPPITRIVVAHRPDTIGAAGRVVSLQGGVARESDDLLF